MKLLRSISPIILGSIILSSTAVAEDFNIKYSSNYLMPAYVHFENLDDSYAINAKINIPLYKIVFSSSGLKRDDHFEMLSYRDLRNGKVYSISEIDSATLTYGKIKNGKSPKKIALKLPTFDLFTMAYQLSYFDKLPSNFQITNGKKLYPMKNVVVKKKINIMDVDGKSQKEVTYRFKTGNKDFMIKKYINEKFPRYISYSRDGDNYELEFDSFE